MAAFLFMQETGEVDAADEESDAHLAAAFLIRSGYWLTSAQMNMEQRCGRKAT